MQKKKHAITKTTLKALRGETARERLLHRLHCVTMALNGSSASEAGRIYGDSPRAVAYWVTQFKQQGIDGLAEEARPGRPTKLSDEQLKKVQIFIKKSQSEAKKINSTAVAAFISKEFGITLNANLCWRILKRITT